jgi:hypothetical protein
LAVECAEILLAEGYHLYGIISSNLLIKQWALERQVLYYNSPQDLLVKYINDNEDLSGQIASMCTKHFTVWVFTNPSVKNLELAKLFQRWILTYPPKSGGGRKRKSKATRKPKF